MIHYRKMLVCLLFVTALLFAGSESFAKSDSVRLQNKVPGQVETTALRLMHDLKKQGFEVSRGYFKLYTAKDCDYTFPKMGSCYGNNPAAPYVTFAVPPWPGEFVNDKSNLWGPSPEGYNDIYRLDPREAIVILGRLPPPAAYFGEQTYLFSREGVIDTTSNNQTYQAIVENLPSQMLPFFFAYVPGETLKDPPPSRFQTFSSLSNPINNVVIERQSHVAFNQVRYFIITPDQLMDAAVRGALAGISIKEEDIFTEPIHSCLKTGLEQASDNFTTVIRYAQPADGGKPGTPSDTWRNDLPLVVLRVRDTTREPLPYTSPLVLEDRTAVSESGLKDDLGYLLAAVGRRWGQPCATDKCSDRAISFLDLQTPPPSTIGPDCMEADENCLGDNWDTTYQINGPYSLDKGEVYAVAGTLGTETGNATYVGLGINYGEKFLGVANLSDEDLKGTAKRYRKEVSHTGQFYLYCFTRDCSGLKHLTDGNCFELTEAMIPSGKHVGFSVRDYIVPGTERGPDSSKVLPSMILQLQRTVKD